MKHVKAAGERDDQPAVVPWDVRETRLLRDVILQRNIAHFFCSYHAKRYISYSHCVYIGLFHFRFTSMLKRSCGESVNVEASAHKKRLTDKRIEFT